jgi:hypothetical protein
MPEWAESNLDEQVDGRLHVVLPGSLAVRALALAGPLLATLVWFPFWSFLVSWTSSFGHLAFI